MVPWKRLSRTFRLPPTPFLSQLCVDLFFVLPPPPPRTAPSPFHPPYTVWPILIKFTNPDGKSGLWQAGCHHEASTKLRLSAIGFLYLVPQLYAACVAARLTEGGASDWGNDSRFRHDTTSPLSCLTGRNSRLSSYTASNQRLPDRRFPARTSSLHSHLSLFESPAFIGCKRNFCFERYINAGKN